MDVTARITKVSVKFGVFLQCIHTFLLRSSRLAQTNIDLLFTETSFERKHIEGPCQLTAKIYHFCDIFAMTTCFESSKVHLLVNFTPNPKGLGT